MNLKKNRVNHPSLFSSALYRWGWTERRPLGPNWWCVHRRHVDHKYPGWWRAEGIPEACLCMTTAWRVEEGQGSWDSWQAACGSDISRRRVLTAFSQVSSCSWSMAPASRSFIPWVCKRSFLGREQRIASQCLVCWREILMDDNHGMFDMSRQHQLKVCTVNVL